MSEDSDKNIWNDRTIERLAELTTKKCNSTERYSITSTPVKRESPSKVNKNIGKKYKASSLPTSPNKTKVLQRRALEQSKVNTSNFTNSNNGSPKKDHKNFNKTNNSAKKNNTVNSTTLFDFFGRSKEPNDSPKDTLQEKLENDEYMLYDTLSKEVSPVISQDQLVDEIDAGDNENCCPVCGKSLKKHTLEESNLHVTECLDNPSGSSTLTTSELSIETKHTILQSNDPSSWNALFSFKSKFTSIQNSQPTIKSHLDNEMKKDTTVKPTSKKECPWYKKLQGTNITVDAFKYGRIPNCTAYFLSHFHSDHYVGLSQKWSHGPIYCSSVTGNLVIQQLRVKPQYVRKLPMNEEVVINNTDTVVTLIDANHCPGSVLFLFKTKCANGETKRYLHTGDFRACPRQVLHSAIVQPNNPPIDILYLDTTYLNERYCFPAQEQVVNSIVQLIKEVIKNGELLPMKRTKKIIKEQNVKPQMVLDQWFKGKSKETSIPPDSGFNNEEESIEMLDSSLSTVNINTDEIKHKFVSLADSKILIVVGTYLIGKEKVFWGIAKALNSKIYVSDAKRKIIVCQENPELEALLTDNPREASVHVMCLTKIKPEGLICYLQNLQPTFNHVMAFRPTGWAYKPSICGTFSTSSKTEEILNSAPSYTMDLINPTYNSPTCQIFGVPYSEHSSFRELAAFIMSLNINRIIPTVNIESAESRKEMDYWLDKWQNEKKKNQNIRIAPYSIIDHW